MYKAIKETANIEADLNNAFNQGFKIFEVHKLEFGTIFVLYKK